MKTIQAVTGEVLLEVMRAHEQWGTKFDEKNTLNDWIAYINIYLGKASSMGASKETVKKELRKAAGLAMSALFHAENESLAPRHYDGQLRPESLPEISTT